MVYASFPGRFTKFRIFLLLPFCGEAYIAIARFICLALAITEIHNVTFYWRDRYNVALETREIQQTYDKQTRHIHCQKGDPTDTLDI